MRVLFLSCLLLTACAAPVVDRAAVEGARAEYAARDTQAALAVAETRVAAEAQATATAGAIVAQFSAERESLALQQTARAIRAEDERAAVNATQLHLAIIGTATAMPAAATRAAQEIADADLRASQWSSARTLINAILLALVLGAVGVVTLAIRAMYHRSERERYLAQRERVVELRLDSPVALLNASGEWEIHPPHPTAPPTTSGTTQPPLGAAENYRRGWAVAIATFAEWWRRLPREAQSRQAMEAPPSGAPSIVKAAGWNIYKEKLEQLGCVVRDPDRGYVITKTREWILQNAHTVIRAYQHGGNNPEPPYVRAAVGKSTSTATPSGRGDGAVSPNTGIPEYRDTADTEAVAEVVNVMTGELSDVKAMS